MDGLCASYEEWRHCITVKCGIPLTADYIAERVAALSNPEDKMTARFVQLYGDDHRVRTLEWFERAGA